jgi:hypothetical protein
MVVDMSEQAAVVTSMTNMLDHEYETLFEIKPAFKNIKYKFSNFIKRTCLNFIKSKYPILQINPLNGLQMNPVKGAQNTLIQARFRKKFLSENEALSIYLNTSYALSEAKRVYFVLDILEKVTNITLENEKY